jgi:FkbH-like protein
MTGIGQVLENLDARPTLAAYTQAARQLRELGEHLRPARVALLASFTAGPLVPFMQVEAARAGFSAEVYLAPFNSARQELLDPESKCLKQGPDVVFVAQLLAEVCPPLADDFLGLHEEQVQQHTEEIVADTLAMLQTFRRHSQAAVVIHNFALPSYPILGIHEAASGVSQTEAIRRLNARLADAVKSVPGVHVLDFDRLCADLGYRNWRDDKMWYLGRAPLSAVALPALARLQAAFVQTLLAGPRKCLVLDLDNTLWGGIIGEDGLAGIKLGRTYPGNVYRDIQQAALHLYRRGILLAVNSKNNPADVEDVFRSHPEMVLKREHFASVRINWRPKPENMVAIADELNIGLDSLVFLDDSPAECALMRQTLPQVLTLEGYGANGAADPQRVYQTLAQGSMFARISFTAEDRGRGEMYRQQAARAQLRQAASSIEDYLRGLQMTVHIAVVDNFTFPRVVDLIQKTNQFNLTTRRHSAAQLAEMIAGPDSRAFAVRVADRFGDNGIVGAAIVRVQDSTACIDTLLLSCRIIGRTVETALLSFLADWARARGATVLEGDFIATAKNAPAADFYARHGFTRVSGNGDAASGHWQLRLDQVPFQWPSYIRSAPEE